VTRGTCSRSVRPHTTRQPARSGPPPLPRPQTGDIAACPYPTLWRGSVHTWCGNDGPPRHILAKGPQVDDKLLLGHPHRDTFGGVLPPSCCSPNRPSAKASISPSGLFPHCCEFRDGPPPPRLPVTLRIQSAGFLAGPDEGPVVRLPPPALEVAQTCPSDEKSRAGGCGGSPNDSLHSGAI